MGGMSLPAPPSTAIQDVQNVSLSTMLNGALHHYSTHLSIASHA
jgi:hypothetical protein